MKLQFEVATREHAEHVAANLRRDDYLELLYSSGDPKQSTIDAVLVSKFAWAGMDDGVPVCVFGVAEQDEHTGIPWMLGTPDLMSHRKEIVVEGSRYVGIMRKLYPYLHNFVYEDNEQSIRWLRAMGFQFGATFPEYGVGKKPFIHFYMNTNV